MRILYVITSLLTGGAEKLIIDLVPKLNEQGCQVDVAVFNAQETPFMKMLEEKRVCKIHKLGQSFYDPRLILRLRKIMKEYDIIHTHNSSPQLYAALANIGLHKHLVTTEHNTSNRKRGNFILKRIDFWMYSKYESIISISDKATANLNEYLGKDNNVKTIFNGVDVNSIYNAKPIQGMHNNRFVALMVAAFRPQKDQDTLIRAMKLLPEDEYEVWFAGTGERMDEVKKLVEELGAQKQVKFLGNRNDVPQLLHTADVVVMSTHYEGLSLSNIEGMSAGKPFVASDVDGIHEVTDGYGMLFKQGDEQALADIIRQLHDDKSLYKNVADRCHTRAMQYDISTMIKSYKQVYDSIYPPQPSQREDVLSGL